MLRKYYRVWKQLSVCAISSYLSNRLDSLSYFIGKVIRLAFFLVLIFSIFRFTSVFGGYSQNEVILFFLTFNLMDVLAQAFFRGIYLFKHDIKRGGFDYIISKPINSLFYSLTRLTDILDLLFLLPIIVLIILIMGRLPQALGLLNIIFYLLLIINGTVIILAIHIISACVTIWKLESENFIWLYRETMTLGRFPPEVFSNFLQLAFTFIMPIFIIVAFPAKALIGVLAPGWLIFAFFYSIGFFIFSLILWKISLRKYSSASS